MSMTVHLRWLNDWCNSHSNYSAVRSNAKVVKVVESNASSSRKEWLDNCVYDLKPDFWSGVASDTAARWAAFPRKTKALFYLCLAANINATNALIIVLIVFRVMSKRRIPWSGLVASQLIMDNVLGLTGSLSAVMTAFFNLDLSNWFCLKTTYPRRLAFTALGWLKLNAAGVLIATQIMILLVIIDRIQAFKNPMRYKIHNRRRRCLLINALSYAIGFAVFMAVDAFATQRFYSLRESMSEPTVYGHELPNTWEDTVCYRRQDIAANCRAPLYVDMVGENGTVLSYKGHRRFWWTYMGQSGSICKAETLWYGVGSALAAFAVTLGVDVAVAVAGYQLVKLFRIHRANRISGANSDADETIVTQNALGVTTGIIFTQSLFGSYLVTFVTFESYRDTLLSLKPFSYLPEPKTLWMVVLSVLGFVFGTLSLMRPILFES